MWKQFMDKKLQNAKTVVIIITLISGLDKYLVFPYEAEQQHAQ